jgi:HEAT repeat protein
MSGAVAAWLVMWTPGARAEEPGPCARVGQALEALVRSSTRASILRRAAPYLGPESLRPLLQRAEEARGSQAFARYFALGLTRQAEALRMLGERPPPTDELARLGRDLALLALGDASQTATLAEALQKGPVQVRRRLVRALGRLHELRPRALVDEALTDEDPEVRTLAAASSLAAGNERAVRTLLEVLRDAPPPVRARAARLLIRAGHRFPPEQIADLPEPLRGPAIAHSRALSSLTDRDLRSTERSLRATALGILAGSRTELVRLKLLARKTPIDSAVEAEQLMALALEGEPTALGRLPGFDQAAIEHATLVLGGYAVQHQHPPPPDTLAVLSTSLEGWMVGRRASEETVLRALRALSAIDSGAALGIARTRLFGPDGSGLRAAIRILGRAANRADLGRLIDLGRRAGLSERSRAEAWLGAARICSR